MEILQKHGCVMRKLEVSRTQLVMKMVWQSPTKAWDEFLVVAERKQEDDGGWTTAKSISSFWQGYLHENNKLTTPRLNPPVKLQENLLPGRSQLFPVRDCMQLGQKIWLDFWLGLVYEDKTCHITKRKFVGLDSLSHGRGNDGQTESLNVNT